jgi:hypothetical protein
MTARTPSPPAFAAAISISYGAAIALVWPVSRLFAEDHP